MKSKRLYCQCADFHCPVHPGLACLTRRARTVLYRADMEDFTGTPMCEQWADDALSSGLFTTRQAVRQ